jgi:UDP-glucose 4-epimerase
MMNVFVTGGAGYIGSATAEALLKTGHSVTVFDSLVNGHQAAIPAGAHFIQADLGNAEALASAFAKRKFAAVMHFAAFIEAGESMKNPGKFFKNNLSNTLQLIETAQAAGVKRFVLSSTAAVYASNGSEWYRRIHGIHFAALRYFNACGALPGRGEDHQPETHLIPLVLKVALGQSEAAEIFGTDYPTPDGTCIRDYIHIADLVSAHLLALDALEQHDRLIYNLGNGNGYSVREVIQTARHVTGHPIPVKEKDRRPGDAPRLVASSDKIRHELGWTPRHPDLTDIVASAWKWHRSHPNGYEK